MIKNVLVFVLLQYVDCQRTPIILSITPDQVKDIGSTVDLSCSVQFADGYPVFWSKIDKYRSSDPIPISTDTKPIIRDSRFSLRFDSASATYTLQIKDMQASDAGFYKCSILVSVTSQVSKETALQVRSPPIIHDNSSSTVNADENSAAKLECYASGVPKPQVYWKRENNAVLPTGGSNYKGNILKINNLKKEDRGTYYCVADNKVGLTVKKTVTLEVEFPPLVRASKTEVRQAVGFDADLECRVEAYPAPIISWIKDGIVLNSNQYYRMTQLATVDQYTDSTLRISSVNADSYGEYICEAANRLGRGEIKFTFLESDRPVCPPACGSGHYSSAVWLKPSTLLMVIPFVRFAY